MRQYTLPSRSVSTQGCLRARLQRCALTTFDEQGRARDTIYLAATQTKGDDAVGAGVQESAYTATALCSSVPQAAWQAQRTIAVRRQRRRLYGADRGELVFTAVQAATHNRASSHVGGSQFVTEGHDRRPASMAIA